MPLYAGLDVSQKTTAICMVDERGERRWRGTSATYPAAISALVVRHAGADAKVGIETGAMTPWLVHGLRKTGLSVECLDARRVKAALQMRLNKTDQNDAEGLAQVVRTGWYRPVHVKSLDAHRARALLGTRAQLVGMRTRLSNMIRGVLKTFGLLPGSGRGQRFDRHVEMLLEGEPDVGLIVRPLLETWRQIGDRIATFDKAVQRQVRAEGVHGEAKTWHGLARAVRRGLDNMRIQSFLTAAAINLKRLAAALLAAIAGLSREPFAEFRAGAHARPYPA